MELFDIAPEPKAKTPTAPQMRFLHVLAKGKLAFKSWPYPKSELTADGEVAPTHFHPVVALNVVRHGWANMKAFDGSQAVYTLSTAGREAIKEFCLHLHLHPEQSAEILAGHLICRKCARRVKCASKQPTKHPATGIHPRYGPICQKCAEYLLSPAK